MISVYSAEVLCLNDEDVFKSACEKVNPQRRLKIDRLKFKKDKLLSLGAGLLLKKAFRDFGIDYENAVFSENEYGKPYIKNSDIQFSLSHCGTYAMCAVSDTAVGCDIEYVTDFDIRIAEKFFCKTEYERLALISDKAERQDLFFRYWTLKESFVKALGRGLSIPLDSFRIEFNERPFVKDTKFYFKEFNLNDGYKRCVCSEYEKIGDIKEIDLMLL